MAIPTGAGTEVLKTNMVTVVNDTAVKLIDGAADHIYTILSITFCEMSNDPETITLRVSENAGANANEQFYLMQLQPLAGNETFVWNDKFVLYETDELVFDGPATCNIDIYVSYIDQHF